MSSSEVAVAVEGRCDHRRSPLHRQRPLSLSEVTFASPKVTVVIVSPKVTIAAASPKVIVVTASPYLSLLTSHRRLLLPLEVVVTVRGRRYMARGRCCHQRSPCIAKCHYRRCFAKGRHRWHLILGFHFSSCPPQFGHG
uniref:Uncharacterized protein n=1 Tax=Arundo donax TaxID=35708 RepID=A0A0A9ARK7_ARUDO